MSDAPKQRLCMNCREWIDARAVACYLCGEEKPEVNEGLVKAVETSRLNGHLAQQAARAHAERQVRLPRSRAEAATGGPQQLYRVPGAQSLAAAYKRALQENGFGE